MYKGLRPKLPPFGTMLHDPPSWSTRFRNAMPFFRKIRSATAKNIDHGEDEALKELADGLWDRFTEYKWVKINLRATILKKYELIDEKCRAKPSEVVAHWKNADGSPRKFGDLSQYERQVNHLWDWYEDAMWIVEEINLCKNVPSYHEHKGISEKLEGLVEDCEAQWLFSDST